jgi:Bacterial Ig domain
MIRSIRLLVAPLLLTLMAGLLPAVALAAAPVAVDDPSDACQPADTFGGSFPIPEDWHGGTTGFEDWFYLFGSCGVLANDTDPEEDPLTWAVVDEPTHGDVLKVDETSFAYRPEPDWSTLAGDELGGDWVSDAFTYVANDGTADSNLATYRFWLSPINDPPTFGAGADVTWSADDGAHDVAWATAISAGPANEGAQTVAFELDVADPSLFTVAPAMDASGHLSFTPKADAAGLTEVTVQAVDDGGLEDYGLSHSWMDPPDDASDPVTFQITITASVLPHAATDTATVAEDDPETVVDVLDNDSDGSDDPIIVVDVTEPAHGTAAVAVDGSHVTYQPGVDYNGPDTFDYTIEAGGEQATASVDVTVTPVEDDPFADDDAATVGEDDPATVIAVLVGDTDVDGDPLDITLTTDGSNGSVVITGGGSGLTYEPDPDANGADTFTYTISDGQGGTDTGVVSVTIDPVNDDPVADDDSITVAEDAAATSVPVLTGDTDTDGDTLSINAKTDGAKGAVVITGGGTGLTYAPNSNANGSDTFTYTVDDGNGGQDTATVSVTITPSNDAPTADNESLTIAEDAAAAAVPVLVGDVDIDSDALTITAKSNGTKGVVTITGGGTGLTYDSNPNANGTDSFTYTISDGHGGTAVGTVNVTITAVNDAPTADNETLTLAEDAAATSVAVLVGDADVDGDALMITTKTNGTKGAVTITGGGTGLTYKPYVGFSGPDAFTYTISDGHGGSATGTVTVTITGVNDPPTAGNDGSITVPEGAPAMPLAVLANDTDPDGDTLKITAVTSGTLGAVTITGGGTGLAYDPAPLKKGIDTFTYTVSDGRGGTDSAVVRVTIVADTTPPTLSAFSESTPSQTLGSQVKVRLSWKAADLGSGVKSYQLQRSLDGAAYATIGPPSATALTFDWNLTPGHAYRFRMRATDREGNVSSYVSWPTLTPATFQEATSLAAYTGSWTTSTNTKMSGGKGRFTGSSAAKVVVSFTGRDVAWITTKTTGSGKAQVYLDGKYQRTVDLRASATQYKQLVYGAHMGLAAHKLEIRPVGDGRVDVDAIVVIR